MMDTQKYRDGNVRALNEKEAIELIEHKARIV